MSRSMLAVVSTIVVVGSLAASSIATAQWGQEPPPNPWATGQPPPQPTYPNAPTPPQAPPPPPPPQPMYAQPVYTQQPFVQPAPRRHRYGPFGEFGIGVPIFLSQDIQLYRPGADLRFAGGFDFGWIAPFADAGFRWTPLDFNRWVAHGGDPAFAGAGRTPLRSFYFGVGVKLQIPNVAKGRVLPYVSGAFDMNFFNFNEVGVACGIWWCTTTNIYHFTPGFTGRLGAAFRIAGHWYADLNVGLSMSFPGSFFDSNQKWIEPTLSFMHRR